MTLHTAASSFLILIFSFLLSFAAQAELVTQLSLPKDPKGYNFEVILTITNTGDITQSVLRREVGADGIQENILSVTSNGRVIPYIGQHHKWAAEPNEQDYLHIESGNSLSFTLSVSDSYQTDLAGQYEIQFVSSSALSNPKEKATTAYGLRSSNVLTSWSEGVNQKIAEKFMEAIDGNLAFSGGCTPDEQNQISQAFDAANHMVDESYHFLHHYAENEKVNSNRYKVFFGEYSNFRWNTVKTRYFEMKNDFENQIITIDCGCDSSSFAYVYPSRYWNIYVCNAFWKAPIGNSDDDDPRNEPSERHDSKAGTLIHEMSHFEAPGIIASGYSGTDDHGYGWSDVDVLATTDPDKSIENADSIEYFAENAGYRHNGVFSPLKAEPFYRLSSTPTSTPTPTLAPTVAPSPSNTVAPEPSASPTADSGDDDDLNDVLDGGSLSVWFILFYVFFSIRNRKIVK